MARRRQDQCDRQVAKAMTEVFLLARELADHFFDDQSASASIVANERAAQKEICRILATDLSEHGGPVPLPYVRRVRSEDGCELIVVGIDNRVVDDAFQKIMAIIEGATVVMAQCSERSERIRDLLLWTKNRLGDTHRWEDGAEIVYSFLGVSPGNDPGGGQAIQPADKNLDRWRVILSVAEGSMFGDLLVAALEAAQEILGKGKPRFDARDERIVAYVRRWREVSCGEIAQHVFLSVPATQKRIKKLMDARPPRLVRMSRGRYGLA